LAVSSGEDIGYVSQQMGHDSINTTLKYYVRYIPKRDRGRKLNAAVSAVTPKLPHVVKRKSDASDNTSISQVKKAA
jgi:hypothetical protein